MADKFKPLTVGSSKSQMVTVLLEQAKTACRNAAIEAYEDAQIRGLCAEGAFEVAMQAIEQVKLPLPDVTQDNTPDKQ